MQTRQADHNTMQARRKITTSGLWLFIMFNTRLHCKPSHWHSPSVPYTNQRYRNFHLSILHTILWWPWGHLSRSTLWSCCDMSFLSQLKGWRSELTFYLLKTTLINSYLLKLTDQFQSINQTEWLECFLWDFWLAEASHSLMGKIILMKRSHSFTHVAEKLQPDPSQTCCAFLL